MNDNLKINDIRKDFKNITFSGYQKSNVKKELLSCIYNKKIENSCYWCAEYVCSGHFSDLWDIMIQYMSKNIHIGNPKLPIYLAMRFKLFISILENGYTSNILGLRNNEKIRKLFMECVTILCFSRKKHSIETLKINSKEEFDITNLSLRLKAPTIEYANNILKEDDPKELIMPVNEFAYNLFIKNSLECTFWLEWILNYETICKKKKKKLICERRQYAPLESQKDIIWIIWDTIILYSKSLKNELIEKIINSLLELFLIRFNESIKKKRKPLIYFAINALLEPINLDIEIIDNKEEIDYILKKIDKIFLQVKKNEVTPKTNYLFNGLEKSNFDKTIEKLDIMNNI